MHFLKEEEYLADLETKDDDLIVQFVADSENVTHANHGLAKVRKVKRPRAIILAPSRQLIEQICAVAKQMTHHCRLRVVGMHSKTRHVAELWETPGMFCVYVVDVLVTTPETLSGLVKDYDVSLSMVSRLVFDEADTLFDRSGFEETKKVLDACKVMTKSTKRPIAISLFTATFPKTLERATSDNIPNLVRLTTSTLHSPPSTIKHDFVRLNQSTTKQNLLLETMRRVVGTTTRVLVFCNTQEMATKVFGDLIAKSYPTVLLSSHVLRSELAKNLDRFTTDNDEFVIAVATDLASRGLDTTRVGHVVLYDFPYNVVDYVHRVGRTGRFGRGGRVTCFVGTRDLALAERIQTCVKMKVALC